MTRVLDGKIFPDERIATCEYCQQHRSLLYNREVYYNDGKSKRYIIICDQCRDINYEEIYDEVSNKRRKDKTIISSYKQECYETIMQIIKCMTSAEYANINHNLIDSIEFYKAVRIAFESNPVSFRIYMGNDFGSNKDNLINENNNRLWHFKYDMMHHEKRIQVISYDPLELKWIKGYITVFEYKKRLNCY